MKQRKTFIFFGLLIFLSFPVFSYRTYGPEAEPVIRLTRLYSQKGMVFPVSGYPLTAETLVRLAEELISSGITGEAEEEAELLIESIRKAPGPAQWGVETDIGLEGRLTGDYQWDEYRDFNERFNLFPDMLFMGLFAEKKDLPGFYISFGIKREYQPGNIPSSNLFIASADDPFRMENYFIRAGYLAWQNDFFDIRFGRAPVHYGDSRFSTFLPSVKIPYLDSFEYRVRLGALEMVSYFSTLENRISSEEWEFFTNGGSLEDPRSGKYLLMDDDYWFYFSEDQILDTAADDSLPFGFDQTIILNAMHRFTYTGKKLSLGVTGLVVVARQSNEFALGDIFPVFSWHNGFVGSNNMLLLLDGLWAVYPGVDLYFQAGWDDINATDIFGIPDNGNIPTIGAYLLGVSYESPGQKVPISGTVEIGTTHYLWGNFHGYSGDYNDGIYLARAIYRYMSQQGVQVLPLTSPYGPGAFWVDGEFHFFKNRMLSGEINLSYLSRNTLASLISTSYFADSAVEDGTRVDSFMGAGTLKYSLPSFLGWDTCLYATLSYHHYADKGWPEFQLGFRTSNTTMGALED